MMLVRSLFARLLIRCMHLCLLSFNAFLFKQLNRGITPKSSLPSPPIPSIATTWLGLPPSPSPFNGSWTIAPGLRQTQNMLPLERMLGLVFVTVIGSYWSGMFTRVMLCSGLCPGLT
jgi:hypothetical protein